MIMVLEMWPCEVPSWGNVGTHRLGDRPIDSQSVKTVHYIMASLPTSSDNGGAGRRRRRRASNVAGSAPSVVRGARSEPNSASTQPSTFRVATWNVGTLKGRGSEVVETLSRRRVDLCGVQEHRWAGDLGANQVRWIEGGASRTRYKFYWCGNPQGGTGILLSESWVEKVHEILRISDRIILMKLIIGKAVFSFLSVYAPQVGLPEAEQERFYDCLLSTVPRFRPLRFLSQWVTGTVMLALLPVRT